jgi:transposase
MAGRQRHSAEDVVRKSRRADELAAEGKTGEEIAAELNVSVATLYNWRPTYGGMDTGAAKELKELREQLLGGCATPWRMKTVRASGLWWHSHRATV